MITNYIPDMCGYGLNNLKKVVHIFSSSSNVVHIDNGEAYVTSGITDLQTISATSVSFEETTAYDDRFKFQKTVTATVNGFAKLSALGGKYYIVLEDVNGIMWLVNVDFPSLVTYTYTLQDGTDETVFTFSALSNFPTLKLNASINNAYACQNYSLVRVDELKMLEKRYANLNASSGIVYGYSNQVYKTVRPYRNSIKVEETFDGTDANTTIQFNIGLDDYQSSWHYNMLEYPYNKYVAVIDHLACGFEMGLVPSYNVQGSHQIGGGDTITVTLVGGSQRGSEWAESWLEVTMPPQYVWKLTDEVSCIVNFQKLSGIEKKTGYIGNVDLGLQLTNNFKIKIKFNYKVANGSLLIGEGGNTRFFKAADGKTYLDLNGQRIYWDNASFCPMNTDLTFELGNRYMKNLGNKKKKTGSTISFTSESNLLLFSSGSNDLAVVYWVKVYDGDTIVGDFIPVRRESDGVVTMYNKVTGTFCDVNGTLYGIT